MKWYINEYVLNIYKLYSLSCISASASSYSSSSLAHFSICPETSVSRKQNPLDNYPHLLQLLHRMGSCYYPFHHHLWYLWSFETTKIPSFVLFLLYPIKLHFGEELDESVDLLIKNSWSRCRTPRTHPQVCQSLQKTVMVNNYFPKPYKLNFSSLENAKLRNQRPPSIKKVITPAERMLEQPSFTDEQSKAVTTDDSPLRISLHRGSAITDTIRLGDNDDTEYLW